MRKLLSAAIVILWAMSSFATAAPSGEAPLPLDMAGAVALALEKNHEVAALREELKGVRAAVELSGVLANPILELEGASGAFTNSLDEKSIGIALSQEIPLSPIGSRRRELARAEAAVLLARLHDYERSLSEEVRRAWIDAALSARRADLALGLQAVAQELLAAARSRFLVGDLAAFEVQLAELDLRRAGLRHDEARSAAEGARRRFALLLGVGSVAELPPFAEIPTPPSDQRLAEAKLLDAALLNRSDLAVQKREGEREAAALALAKAEAVPPVTVALSYREERSAQNSYDFSGSQLIGQTEQTRDRIMGMKLSVPLPIFSRNQAETTRASARVSAARFRLEGLKRTVSGEVRDLLSQYRLALTALDLHRTALGPVAQENLQIQHVAFKLGEIGMQAVLDEKRRLSEQMEAELTALQAALDARAKLESTIGGGLTDMNVVTGGKP